MVKFRGFCADETYGVNVQEKQGSGEGIEHPTSWGKGPLLPHTVFTVHMGASQIMHLEAMVDILEKS